jgi:hypothetical protein
MSTTHVEVFSGAKLIVFMLHVIFQLIFGFMFSYIGIEQTIIIIQIKLISFLKVKLWEFEVLKQVFKQL